VGSLVGSASSPALRTGSRKQLQPLKKQPSRLQKGANDGVTRLQAESRVINFQDQLHQRFINATEAFRSMDTNGDNRLSKEELKFAMDKFNISVSPETLSAMFQICDTNEDGEISLVEFGQALRRDQSQTGAVFGKNDKYVTQGHIVTGGTGAQVLINDNLAMMAPHQIGQKPAYEAFVLGHTLSKADSTQLEGYRKAMQDKIYHKFKHLTDAFRQMDENHDGKLSKAEIVDTVANFSLGIPYEHVIQLVDQLADTDQDGEVDYNEFAAALKRKDVQETDFIP